MGLIPVDAVHADDLPSWSISFDIEAFDEAIRSQGVTLVHWRAMRCPVGMTEQYDTERPHPDHSGCSNGFIYTVAGKITALFTGNSNAKQALDMGLLDGSTVQVTLPRFYDETQDPIYIAPFDRLYLNEESIAVVHWQLFTAHASGRERLSFPAVKVQDLLDSAGQSYRQGQEFDLDRGQVVWRTEQPRPGQDPETGKGSVCAVRYLYRPYWYVKNMVHEVRVTQAENPATGERVTQRMPQALVLQREYVFEARTDDGDPAQKDVREPKRPADGIYAPR